ncbi:sorting nexin-18-like [Rhopilema esculentum]|uniref:sorting nexin-18-like n=1 Tax=Rhopilema esculentum TaxID=499914 RepID=UPI0031D41764|eukprot:gene12786-3520_t
MATRVSVLYDFDGDTQNGELVVREGDHLTVTDKDVGEGWWEGLDSYGNRGLFPAAYVKVLEDGPPSRPPPAPIQSSSPQYLSISPTRGYDKNDGDWEDEWDDGSSVASDSYSGDYAFSSNNAPRTMSVSRAGTVKKSMNRFSTFVKSGGEAFLLGANQDSTLQSQDKVVIEDSADGIIWQNNPIPFICAVSEPEKKSKYKGIKSYVAYQIVPTHTDKAVSHRFKHFDWLYGRLVEKFPTISVPPLPDKQITGRYADEFIQKRRQLLELWMNRVSRHPVIAQCEVFQHFIKCDSEAQEKEWKAGKRRAECDKLVGSQFFYTISSPAQNLSQQQVEHKVEHFKDFVKGMDESVKTTISRFEEYWDKVARSYRNEYKRFASGFLQLSGSFAPDAAAYSLPLTQAIEDTGRTYEEIGDLCQDQPRKDASQMIDLLREYSGILSTFPDIVIVQKSAMSKLKECQKLQEEEKMEYNEVADVSARLDVMTNCVFAEINHFQRERVRDFKKQMQHFIGEQIQFHQEIINKLQSSLEKYNYVPDD